MQKKIPLRLANGTIALVDDETETHYITTIAGSDGEKLQIEKKRVKYKNSLLQEIEPYKSLEEISELG